MTERSWKDRVRKSDDEAKIVLGEIWRQIEANRSAESDPAILWLQNETEQILRRVAERISRKGIDPIVINDIELLDHLVLSQGLVLIGINLRRLVHETT